MFAGEAGLRRAKRALVRAKRAPTSERSEPRKKPAKPATLRVKSIKLTCYNLNKGVFFIILIVPL